MNTQLPRHRPSPRLATRPGALRPAPVLALALALALALLVVAAAGPAGAQDAAGTEGRQLAFIGARAPAGSLAGAGLAQTVVVLRWMVLEGDLPPDVTALRLLRDDREIYRHPRGTVASPAEINARYARPENARRRQELAAVLRDAPVPGDTADLGASVAARLRAAQADPGARLWARTVARLDPELAELAGEAFIDRRVGPEDAPLYRLEAVAADGRTARLGEVQIEPGQVHRAGPVSDLQQVTDLDRCDAPESGRRHGVVALDWDAPGEHAGERYAQSLFIAGYDVWCARAAENGLPNRDLAALVAAGRLDRDGQPTLDGLVRVNRRPIVAAGRPEVGPDGRRTEARLRGHNAPFAQWAQTASEVAAQGLQPGDRRACYVVARDLTGNYGATRAVAVVVPDALAPPAPWDARALPRQRDGLRPVMDLRWPAIDVRSLHASRADGRLWCNLDTAALDGRLRFADPLTGCAGPTQSLNADVSHYLVYRFDDPRAASDFADTDGDGYADADERIVAPGTGGGGAGGAGLTLPGTTCDADLHPAGATPVLPERVEASEARLDGGRPTLHFADDLPAIDRGQTWWYRVAAVGRNGEISPLGPPVRAHFPAYDKPAQPAQDPVRMVACEPVTALAPAPEVGFTVIDRLGQASAARFSCVYTAGGGGSDIGNPSSNQQPPVGAPERILGLGTYPLATGAGGVRTLDNKIDCAAAVQAGQCRMVVELLDATGARLGAVAVPPDQVANPDTGTCAFTVTRDQRCDPEAAPPAMGGIIEGDQVLLSLEPRVTDCVDVYLDTGSPAQRLTTLCPDNPQFEWRIPGLGAQLVCLTYSVVNENAQTSTRTSLPCVRTTARARLLPPTILEIAFDPTGDRLRWRAPEAPSSGILVEWWRQGGAEAWRQSTYLGHDGRYGYDEIHSALLALPPLGAAPETWCVRARTVDAGGEGTAHPISTTSPDWCGRRAPPAEPLPEYLPWPPEPAPIIHPDRLAVRVLPGDGVPAVRLSLRTPALRVGACNLDQLGQLCAAGAPCVRNLQAIADEACDLCGALRTAESPHTRYVVYRQARSASGALEPFEQVTPLIESGFCRRTCRKVGNCDNQGVSACGPGDNVCADTWHDPFVQLLRFPPGDAWPEQVVAFVDRSPLVGGQAYRYQFIYFDPQGEVTERRDTDWVAVEVVP